MHDKINFELEKTRHARIALRRHEYWRTSVLNAEKALGDAAKLDAKATWPFSAMTFGGIGAVWAINSGIGFNLFSSLALMIGGGVLGTAIGWPILFFGFSRWFPKAFECKRDYAEWDLDWKQKQLDLYLSKRKIKTYLDNARLKGLSPAPKIDEVSLLQDEEAWNWLTNPYKDSLFGKGNNEFEWDEDFVSYLASLRIFKSKNFLGDSGSNAGSNGLTINQGDPDLNSFVILRQEFDRLVNVDDVLTFDLDTQTRVAEEISENETRFASQAIRDAMLNFSNGVHHKFIFSRLGFMDDAREAMEQMKITPLSVADLIEVVRNLDNYPKGNR